MRWGVCGNMPDVLSEVWVVMPGVTTAHLCCASFLAHPYHLLCWVCSQNAAPDGPVTWMLMDITSAPLRWMVGAGSFPCLHIAVVGFT
jgi:hypothetical protein